MATVWFPMTDRSSEEEDTNFVGTLKNTNLTTPQKPNVSPNTTNGTQKSPVVKSSSPKTVLSNKDTQKAISKTNGSSTIQNQINNITQCTKTQNGSSCSTITSSAKYQNGKSETNGRTESNNSKTKWHQSVKGKVGQDEKVITKAASSSMKGWEVSKDTFSPTSTAVPNGWSVTDK